MSQQGIHRDPDPAGPCKAGATSRHDGHADREADHERLHRRLAAEHEARETATMINAYGIAVARPFATR
jgi:hypothetical protein